MSRLRTALITVILILMGSSLRADLAAPEIFEEFTTGWVEYDDGAYAAALRAFARAHNLDPAFAPAVDGIQSSLRQMGMSEIADSIEKRARRFLRSERYQPTLAYWGVHSEQTFEIDGVEQIDTTMMQALELSSGLPVHLISPSSQAWQQREAMIPAQYNLLPLLTIDHESGDLLLRIHLIAALDVSQGNSLDLLMPNEANNWELQHREWTLRLPKTGLVAHLKSPAIQDEIEGLLFGEWQNPVAPFIEDPETASLPKFEELETIWEVFSKAAVTKNPRGEWFTNPRNARNSAQGALQRFAYHEGFLHWTINNIATTDPLRPWLLAHDLRNEGLTHLEKVFDSAILEDELLSHYPDHLATKTIHFNQLIRQLSPENVSNLSPEILQILDLFISYNASQSANTSSLTRYKNTLENFGENSQSLDTYSETLAEIHVFLNGSNNQPEFRKRSLAPSPIKEFANDLSKEARIEYFNREARFILQFNPYIQGSPEALEKELFTLLAQYPNSGFLNALLYKVRSQYKKEGKNLNEAYDIFGHAITLIETMQSTAGITRVLNQSFPNPEQSGKLAAAIDRRLKRSSDQQILKDTYSSVTLMQVSRAQLNDLSSEAKQRWLSAFSQTTPFTSGIHRDTYKRFIKFLLQEGEVDYVRAHISRTRVDIKQGLENEKALWRKLAVTNHICQTLIKIDRAADASSLIRGLNDLAFNDLDSDSAEKHHWFQFKTSHAHQLFEIGEYEKCIQLANETLEQLDGTYLVYYTLRGTHSNDTVAMYLFNLKKKSLDALQTK